MFEEDWTQLVCCSIKDTEILNIKWVRLHLRLVVYRFNTIGQSAKLIRLSREAELGLGHHMHRIFKHNSTQSYRHIWVPLLHTSKPLQLALKPMAFLRLFLIS